MKINVGKIKQYVNNRYIILGIDNKEYYLYPIEGTYNVNDIVAFRGESFPEFNKAFFVQKIDHLTPIEQNNLKRLFK